MTYQEQFEKDTGYKVINDGKFIHTQYGRHYPISQIDYKEAYSKWLESKLKAEEQENHELIETVKEGVWLLKKAAPILPDGELLTHIQNFVNQNWYK